MNAWYPQFGQMPSPVQVPASGPSTFVPGLGNVPQGVANLASNWGIDAFYNLSEEERRRRANPSATEYPWLQHFAKGYNPPVPPNADGRSPMMTSAGPKSGPPLNTALVGDAENGKAPDAGGAKPEIVRGLISQIIPSEQTKAILEGRAPMPPAPQGMLGPGGPPMGGQQPQAGGSMYNPGAPATPKSLPPPMVTMPVKQQPPPMVTMQSRGLPDPNPSRYQMSMDPFDGVFKTMKRFAEGFGAQPTPQAVWSGGQWMVPVPNPSIPGAWTWGPYQAPAAGAQPAPQPGQPAAPSILPPPVLPNVMGQYTATAEERPWIDQVLGMRRSVKYPRLNPYDVGYFNESPTLRDVFEKGRQAEFGVPQQDSQWESYKFRLPGVPRSSVRLGY